jgi:hypothetical protein
VADAIFLQPDGVALHGTMHEYADKALKGTRAARTRAQELQVLVFEAFRHEGELFVDPAVADLLEPRMLPQTIRLIAHLRPHRNPEDVAFHPATDVAFI